MWFMKNNKDISLYYRELPLDTEEIERIPDSSKPLTALHAIMQAMPGAGEAASDEEPNPIREALLDSMEVMTEQDKFIIDAIYWEMITFEELGNRLGVSTTHAWRLTRAAEKNLKELLMMNTTLRDYILDEF